MSQGQECKECPIISHHGCHVFVSVAVDDLKDQVTQSESIRYSEQANMVRYMPVQYRSYRPRCKKDTFTVDSLLETTLARTTTLYIRIPVPFKAGRPYTLSQKISRTPTQATSLLNILSYSNYSGTCTMSDLVTDKACNHFIQHRCGNRVPVNFGLCDDCARNFCGYGTE